MNNETFERVVRLEERQKAMEITIKSLLESIKNAQKKQNLLVYAVILIAIGEPVTPVLIKILGV